MVKPLLIAEFPVYTIESVECQNGVHGSFDDIISVHTRAIGVPTDDVCTKMVPVWKHGQWACMVRCWVP